MAEFQLNQSNWTTTFMPSIWLSPAKGCDVAFNGFITPTMCVFGFVTSLFTLFGLRGVPEKDSSTIWLLKTLALLDSIYILLFFVFSSAITIARFNWIFGMTMYKNYGLLIVQPLVIFAHNLITWIVALVTVDRYLAVCKPMNIKWRELRRVKRAVKWLVITAVVLNAPCICKMAHDRYRRDRCIDVENTDTTNCITIKYVSDSLQIFNVVLYSMLASVVPLIILIILNVRIALVLRALTKKRRQMSRQTNSERSLTKALVAVVVVFVVCQLPEPIVHFIHFARLDVDLKATYCAVGIAYTLIALNSSLNFIIYYLCSRRFKRIFSGMLPCHTRQRNVVLVV